MNSVISKLKYELADGKKYYILLSIVLIFITILNWNANLMEGILPYYNNFTNFFKNGFRYNEITNQNVYTWPMWGYGIVLLLKYKLLIIILQQLFSFLIIVFVRIYLKQRLNAKSFNIVSILLLSAFPWFFFQVSLWPYGISANLLTISLILFSIGVEKIRFSYIIVSAVTFGVMLNFRSDYFYLTFFICIAIFIFGLFSKFQKKIFLFALVWASIILVTLIPWGIYCYQYSSNFSLVSTNSGHVFYISLGQLPDNKWSITPSDEDLSMRKLVDSNFSINESTLSTRSNKLLKSKFIRLITNDPKEYLRKCIYNLKSFIINPFYLGSVHLKKQNIDNFKSELKYQFRSNNYIDAFKLIYKEFGLLIIFPILTYIIGQGILLLFLFSMFKFVIRIKTSKDFYVLNILIIVLFLYQLALSVFGYYLPIYSTNIYLLLIILIGMNLDKSKLV